MLTFPILVLAGCSGSNSKNVVLAEDGLGFEVKIIELNETQREELLNLHQDLILVFNAYQTALEEGVEVAKQSVHKLGAEGKEVEDYYLNLNSLEKATLSIEGKWKQKLVQSKNLILDGIEKRKNEIASIKRKISVHTKPENIKIFERNLVKAEAALQKTKDSLENLDNKEEFEFFRKDRLRSELSEVGFSGRRIYKLVIEQRLQDLLKTATELDHEKPVSLEEDTVQFILWAKGQFMGKNNEVTRTHNSFAEKYKNAENIKVSVTNNVNVRTKDSLSVFGDFNQELS